MSKFVNSKIKLNIPKINLLDKAAVGALKQTTLALNTEVKEDQVEPFGQDIMKDGKVVHQGGNLSHSAYAETKNADKGETSLNNPTVYARRLYYHPEYNFNRQEHKNAKGKWYEDYIQGKKKKFCSETFSKIYKREAGL